MSAQEVQTYSVTSPVLRWSPFLESSLENEMCQRRHCLNRTFWLPTMVWLFYFSFIPPFLLNDETGKQWFSIGAVCHPGDIQPGQETLLVVKMQEGGERRESGCYRHVVSGSRMLLGTLQHADQARKMKNFLVQTVNSA